MTASLWVENVILTNTCLCSSYVYIVPMCITSVTGKLFLFPRQPNFVYLNISIEMRTVRKFMQRMPGFRLHTLLFPFSYAFIVIWFYFALTLFSKLNYRIFFKFLQYFTILKTALCLTAETCPRSPVHIISVIKSYI